MIELADERTAALGQTGDHTGIGEDFLHLGLCVVKIPLDGVDRDVLPALGHHLELLHRADPVVGIKDSDLHPFNAAEALQRGLAGIPGGSDQNQDLLAVEGAAGCRDHQMRQQLQRHILEGAGRAMPEFKNKASIRKVGKGAAQSSSKTPSV